MVYAVDCEACGVAYVALRGSSYRGECGGGYGHGRYPAGSRTFLGSGTIPHCYHHDACSDPVWNG